MNGAQFTSVLGSGHRRRWISNKGAACVRAFFALAQAYESRRLTRASFPLKTQLPADAVTPAAD